jgi:hypothetical protein
MHLEMSVGGAGRRVGNKVTRVFLEFLQPTPHAGNIDLPFNVGTKAQLRFATSSEDPCLT